MSDLIPPLLPWVAVHLAAMGILLSLLRLVRPALPGPSTPHLIRIPVGTPPPRPWHRPELPLDGAASRMVRPYVVAVEQAARRRELVLAELGFDGPGPYVIHGVEVG
ncbi:hypothetical protein ACFS5L_39960 [Streptomyces phyllanthi]|uniref:hypothetical protein n=1 Tax=Streptomyces phyllanthi TaxID=1803180 RepID=UPI0031E6FB2A